MGSGSFGSPPTDESIRAKLAAFRQQPSGGRWNTPKHLGRVLAISREAPHTPDDHTLIWLVQGTLHPQLQSKMRLTSENQQWQTFAEYSSSLRKIGRAHV